MKIIDEWPELRSSTKNTLLQSMYSCVAAFFSALLLAWLSWKLRTRRVELSDQIQIHIISWVIFMVITFAYVSINLVLFNGNDADYSLLFMCIRGAASSSVVSVSPLTTFFLTLDRSLYLVFPLMDRRWHKWGIQIGSIFTLLLLGFSVAWLSFSRVYALAGGPNVTTTKCISYGCLASGNTDEILWMKISFGVCNILLGCFFVYIYLRYGKKTVVKKEKKKNVVVLWSFFSELFFNIIPMVGHLYAYQPGTGSTIPLVKTIAGFLASMFTPAFVADGLFQALIFYYTWSYEFSKKKTMVRRVAPPTITTPPTVPPLKTFNFGK